MSTSQPAWKRALTAELFTAESEEVRVDGAKWEKAKRLDGSFAEFVQAIKRGFRREIGERMYDSEDISVRVETGESQTRLPEAEREILSNTTLDS